MLDVAEDCHPDDCIDKSDESQQRADVEQRRQGDNQGEQQLPDTLGSLDIQPWSMNCNLQKYYFARVASEAKNSKLFSAVYNIDIIQLSFYSAIKPGANSTTYLISISQCDSVDNSPG